MFINKNPPKDKYIPITSLEYRLSKRDKYRPTHKYGTEFKRLHYKCTKHGIKITIAEDYYILEYLGHIVKYYPRKARFGGRYVHNTPGLLIALFRWKRAVYGLNINHPKTIYKYGSFITIGR